MKCEICKKEFKNLNGLSAHITKIHKNISQQKYYDTYLRSKDFKNICPTCGKPTDFISIGHGYKTHCNRLCSNSDPTLVTTRHETINKIYGGHALCFKETQEKCKESLFRKYGVNNSYNIPQVKENAHSKEALEKHTNTLRKNKTFKTSKQEDKCYELLSNFFFIERNYYCTRYPFKCDFYIPALDVFIECNFHWTHGGHWFDSASIEDQLLLSNWINSSSKYKKLPLILGQ